GFPRIPLKVLVPGLQTTLIESQNKKATFLREVIRALRLNGIQVYSGHAESSGLTAKTVTMRAVEKFEESVPIAASLVEQGERLTLLIGAEQVEKSGLLTPLIKWNKPMKITGSKQRILLIGIKQ